MMFLSPRDVRRLGAQLVLTGVRFNFVLIESALAVSRLWLNCLRPPERSTREAKEPSREAKQPARGAKASAREAEKHGPQDEPTSEPRGPAPAVPIEKSVMPDRVVCLEDGKAFTTLKRHLRTAHGLSPAQYRAKWGLRTDYPLVAPRYAAARSKVAKQIGLGGRRPTSGHTGKGKQARRAHRQTTSASGSAIH